MTTATKLTVVHTGRTPLEDGDRLEIRNGLVWEAVVYVYDGMWAKIKRVRFVDFAGNQAPLAKERGMIRRAAQKWVRANR